MPSLWEKLASGQDVDDVSKLKKAIEEGDANGEGIAVLDRQNLETTDWRRDEQYIIRINI